jgi:hypothetical protein
MIDYIKFWLAKELVPFIIIFGIAAICFMFIAVLVLLDKFQRWRKGRKAGPQREG